jgi:hypothetical protein
MRPRSIDQSSKSLFDLGGGAAIESPLADDRLAGHKKPARAIGKQDQHAEAKEGGDAAGDSRWNGESCLQGNGCGG